MVNAIYADVRARFRFLTPTASENKKRMEHDNYICDHVARCSGCGGHYSRSPWSVQRGITCLLSALAWISLFHCASGLAYETTIVCNNLTTAYPDTPVGTQGKGGTLAMIDDRNREYYGPRVISYSASLGGGVYREYRVERHPQTNALGTRYFFARSWMSYSIPSGYDHPAVAFTDVTLLVRQYVTTINGGVQSDGNAIFLIGDGDPSVNAGQWTSLKQMFLDGNAQARYESLLPADVAGAKIIEFANPAQIVAQTRLNVSAHAGLATRIRSLAGRTNSPLLLSMLNPKYEDETFAGSRPAPSWPEPPHDDRVAGVYLEAAAQGIVGTWTYYPSLIITSLGAPQFSVPSGRSEARPYAVIETSNPSLIDLYALGIGPDDPESGIRYAWKMESGPAPLKFINKTSGAPLDVDNPATWTNLTKTSVRAVAAISGEYVISCTMTDADGLVTKQNATVMVRLYDDLRPFFNGQAVPLQTVAGLSFYNVAIPIPAQETATIDELTCKAYLSEALASIQPPPDGVEIYSSLALPPGYIQPNFILGLPGDAATLASWLLCKNHLYVIASEKTWPIPGIPAGEMVWHTWVQPHPYLLQTRDVTLTLSDAPATQQGGVSGFPAGSVQSKPIIITFSQPPIIALNQHVLLGYKPTPAGAVAAPLWVRGLAISGLEGDLVTAVAVRNVSSGLPTPAIANPSGDSDDWGTLTFNIASATPETQIIGKFELQVTESSGLTSAWTPIDVMIIDQARIDQERCNSNCGKSPDPVYYATGELEYYEDDLEGLGDLMGVRRSYMNLMPSAAGDLGPGWVTDARPYVQSIGTALRQVVLGGERRVVFEKVGAAWLAQSGSLASLQEQASGDVVFQDASGGSYVFHGSAQGIPAPQRGQLKSYMLPTGEHWQMRYTGQGMPMACERTTPQGAQEALVFDMDIATRRLRSVSRMTARNGAAPVMSRSARYTYYDATDTKSPDAHLKRVEILDGTQNVIRQFYYRYYPTGNASAGLLRYCVGPRNYERMLQAGFDPMTASDTTLASYADKAFSYDASRRITQQLLKTGDVDGIGTYTYTYTKNPNFPTMAAFLARTPAEQANIWLLRTTETMPDGSQNIVYTSRQKTVLAQQTKGTDPVANIVQSWYDAYRYDAEGREVSHAHRSAVLGIDETLEDLVGWSAGTKLSTNSGLITDQAYYGAAETTNGAAPNRLKETSRRQGTGGAKTLVRVLTYQSHANAP